MDTNQVEQQQDEQEAFHADMVNRQQMVTEILARLEREGCITPDQASLLRWAAGV